MAHICRARRRKIIWLAAGAIGLSWYSQPVGAATRTWNNAAGGNFNVAGNWLGSVIPGTADTAHFALDAASPYTVSFTTSPTTLRCELATDAVSFAMNSNTYT